tara:strand:- start:622 stop:813 length:192 start_codon:yes stop_codon:yes gene_type:complete
MSKIKKGDLVNMKTHETGLVGIVMDFYPREDVPGNRQIGIKWFGGSGKTDWEPEAWLEIVSQS